MIRPSIQQTIELVQRTLRAGAARARRHRTRRCWSAARRGSRSCRRSSASSSASRCASTPTRSSSPPGARRGKAGRSGGPAGRPGRVRRRRTRPPPELLLGRRRRSPPRRPSPAACVRRARRRRRPERRRRDDDAVGRDVRDHDRTTTSPDSAPTSAPPADRRRPRHRRRPRRSPFVPFAVASEIPTLPGPIDLELVGNDLWVMSEAAGTLQRFDITQPTSDAARRRSPLGFTGAEGRNGNDVIPVDGGLLRHPAGRRHRRPRRPRPAPSGPCSASPSRGRPFNGAVARRPRCG